MVDPQKPDPDVFWCKKCQCHGEFVEKVKRRYDSERGHYTVRNDHCVICDEVGGVPIRGKEFAITDAKMLGIAALTLNVICITVATFRWGFEKGFLEGIFLCPLLSVLLGGAFFWLPRNARSMDFYIAWKKWAKERGWEEVKPKGK